MNVTIPAILQSKKFFAAALASGMALLGLRYGLELQEIGVAIAPLLTYVGAQGIADHGKERAKAERQLARLGEL